MEDDKEENKEENKEEPTIMKSSQRQLLSSKRMTGYPSHKDILSDKLKQKNK
eukprot:CAMPEP_0205804094 /NCGR_PEP_ID=MMETSP0205-20121125/6885_1 /ASSEMBLY_ACC=CAM_ASM_000278 /TAXON_ID=36767 /ORGANISM="Euplotes focardii, Strain TN1" /LENGTH=51 /DNA_ID=CAMNT_0053073103 /DNA_START=577 /DNA_END=729 /DNA_ORIENTATION=-